jgi:hypothetical protein
VWCSCHLPDGDPRVSYFSGQAPVAVASRGGTAEPPPGSLLRCLPAAGLVPSSAAAGAIAPTRALHCKTREEKKSRTYQTAKGVEARQGKKRMRLSTPARTCFPSTLPPPQLPPLLLPSRPPHLLASALAPRSAPRRRGLPPPPPPVVSAMRQRGRRRAAPPPAAAGGGGGELAAPDSQDKVMPRWLLHSTRFWAFGHHRFCPSRCLVHFDF